MLLENLPSQFPQKFVQVGFRGQFFFPTVSFNGWGPHRQPCWESLSSLVLLCARVAWSGHVNQKVNETKACPTMLLVCAPVTKKDTLEKQIAPETLLAQISAENGRPEQSEGIPGELCRSILCFFFRRPCFHGQRSTRSKPPAWESLFVRVPAFFFSPAALASDLRAFACVF